MAILLSRLFFMTLWEVGLHSVLNASIRNREIEVSSPT
jgi:hypothetical protein